MIEHDLPYCELTVHELHVSTGDSESCELTVRTTTYKTGVRDTHPTIKCSCGLCYSPVLFVMPVSHKRVALLPTSYLIFPGTLGNFCAKLVPNVLTVRRDCLHTLQPGVTKGGHLSLDHVDRVSRSYVNSIWPQILHSSNFRCCPTPTELRKGSYLLLLIVPCRIYHLHLTTN